MKQRRKVILALLLSASVAATPIASVPVLAEELDFAAVEDVEVDQKMKNLKRQKNLPLLKIPILMKIMKQQTILFL